MEETERRFVVLSMNEEILKRSKSIDIKQGYYDISYPEHRSLRIRLICKKDPTERREIIVRAILGTKEGFGISRQEKETEIDIDTGKFLMENCSHYIEKKRYFLEGRGGKGKWTLDAFKSPLRGKIIEIELDDKNQKIQFPPYIFRHIEITDTVSSLNFARLATELRSDNNSKASICEKIGKPLSKIVITGGPCSGKSEMMKEIKRRVENVHIVPEVATILKSQLGMNIPVSDKDNKNKTYRFNQSVYRIQRVFEGTVSEEAAENNKKAIIEDRGTLDGAAYLPRGIKDLEAICGTKEEYELYRYKCVIFLEVPSRGIYEQFFGNNKARHENYAEAVFRGEKIKKAWSNHPNFHIIPKTDNWEEKVQATLSVIRKELK